MDWKISKSSFVYFLYFFMCFEYIVILINLSIFLNSLTIAIWEVLIPILIVLIGEIIICIYIVRKIKVSGFKEETNKIGLEIIVATIFMITLLTFVNFLFVFKQGYEIYTLLYIIFLILSSIILSIEIYFITK